MEAGKILSLVYNSSVTKYITKERSLIYSALLFLLVTGSLLAKQSEVEPATVAQRTVHCLGANANFNCAMNHFELITRAYGPRRAMENLKQEYAVRPEVVSDCHQLAHVIGNTTVDRVGGDIREAFRGGDSFCWSGYYHGVVERAVEDLGEEAFTRSADALCAAIPGKERYSFDYYNCVHGLGHGIMAVENNELFASLPLCDHLSGEWERKSCYGGVFMENIMVDNRIHKAKYLKKDDLMYPCNAVDKVYKDQCYLMQTSYALSQNNYDFKNAFDLCMNVETDFRDTCAQSIGRDASGLTVSNVARTVINCSFANDDRQRERCIEGAVKDFISYYHGGTEAQLLCKAFPSRFEAYCSDVRTSYLKTL